MQLSALSLALTRAGLLSEFAPAYSPINLFTPGVNGLWLDPSDLSTMFQNAAGTTPVTAVEQPVGLILDKSKGLVLGPELATNGTFDINVNGWLAAYAYGNTYSSFISSGLASFSGAFGGVYQDVAFTSEYAMLTVRARIASGTSFFVYAYNYGGFSTVTSGYVLNSSEWKTYRLIVKRNGGGMRLYFQNQPGNSTLEVSSISVKEISGNHATNPSGNSANFPVLSARYNLYTATETLATQNVTTAATTYRLGFSGTGSITLSGTATGVYTAGTHTITCTAGTLTSTVIGSVTQADIRPANLGASLPAYQRINTSTDYDSDPTKFPWYLKFSDPSSSVNRWLQTASIDFTSTDKMFVCAGLRKLSDASTSVFLELSSNYDVTLSSFVAYNSISERFGFNAKGAQTFNRGGIFSSTGYLAPITTVYSAIANLTSSSRILRLDGIDAASSSLTIGGGTFLNAPLYIGARAGSSLWFNGQFHQLVVAGKQASASEISDTETFVNQKTGAY